MSILCLFGLGVLESRSGEEEARACKERGTAMVMIRAVLFDPGHNPKLCYVASAQAQKAKAKKEEKKFLAASSFTKRLFDTSKFSLESQLSMSQCNEFELLPAY